MEDVHGNHVASTRRDIDSRDPKDANLVPSDSGDDLIGELAATNSRLVDVWRCHEWVRPASDVAAQRLANQRRHYQTNDVRDDSCATFLPNGVRPEMLSVMTSENPLQTGDTALAKTFITDHLVSLALALSLAVSVLTAVTTLSITGDLPGHRDGTATREPPTAPDRPVANQLRSVDTNMFELAAMRRATKRAYSAVSAIQSQSQFDESGRIDVNQLLADQRADLAAGERFMEAKFERMGAGFEQSSEFEEQKPE